MQQWHFSHMTLCTEIKGVCPGCVFIYNMIGKRSYFYLFII